MAWTPRNNKYGPRREDVDVFVENSTYARHKIKLRIMKQGLLPNICAICGQLPEWNGMLLVLILDHINGVNNDNRIDNLRLICHHCDSQLPTYKARNKKTNRKNMESWPSGLRHLT